MKKLLFIFVVMTFCLTVSAQKKTTDREMKGLKGAVKTVFEEYMVTSRPSNNTDVNKRIKEKEYYFDKNGNLTQIMYPSHNEKLIYSIIDGFKTFKSGPIKVDNTPKDKMMTRAIGEEKPLEENEKIVPPDDRFTLKYVYEYDANGRVAKEKHYGNNGKLFRIAIYEYDDKGRVIKESEQYTGSIAKYTHKYDDNGNLIETLEDRDVKNGFDSQTKRVFSDYKTDAQGNWTERKEMWTSKATNDTYTATTIYYRKIVYY